MVKRSYRKKRRSTKQNVRRSTKQSVRRSTKQNVKSTKQMGGGHVSILSERSTFEMINEALI